MHRNCTVWMMAFLSGWSDIVCLSRYLDFATMMTGNTWYMALDASKGCWLNALVFGITIVCCCVGVFYDRLFVGLLVSMHAAARCWEATFLGLLTLPFFIMADISYYYWDNTYQESRFGCGRPGEPKHGVFGITLGAINNMSMRYLKATTCMWSPVTCLQLPRSYVISSLILLWEPKQFQMKAGASIF